MQTECDQMAVQLQRISAPNLRAGDKLGTVEERLRSTEVEFDDARRRARKTKAHFEKIKRMRHERWDPAIVLAKSSMMVVRHLYRLSANKVIPKLLHSCWRHVHEALESIREVENEVGGLVNRVLKEGDL